MRDKARVLLHAALFFLIYHQGSLYLAKYLPLPDPQLFQYLDSLTGYPHLAHRIALWVFALMLYALFTVFWDRENWKQALFVRDSWKGLLKGAAFTLMMVMGVLLVFQLTGLMRVEGFIADRARIAALLFAWVVAQIFNALQEELVFRGYLLRRLATQFNPHLCAILVSLLFGLGHLAQYQFAGFLFATSSGLCFAYVYLHYRNIYVPIGMHGVWDICSHTILNGKIFITATGVPTNLMGMSDRTSYYAVAIAAQLLFLGVFFVWERLWRPQELELKQQSL
ncbi:CPBP family intramembrane glutamic endopeptidase [Phyllobacterium salinisoli]|nr:CPBP family intramembrane glutamic endopeptidase [Phyllobacterium salinisoli]